MAKIYYVHFVSSFVLVILYPLLVSFLLTQHCCWLKTFGLWSVSQHCTVKKKLINPAVPDRNVARTTLYYDVHPSNIFIQKSGVYCAGSGHIGLHDFHAYVCT